MHTYYTLETDFSVMQNTKSIVFIARNVAFIEFPFETLFNSVRFLLFEANLFHADFPSCFS